MSYTVRQIAEALGATLLGDGSVEILRAAEPAAAGPEDLALAMQPKYAEGLATSGARAAIVWEGADWRGYGLEAAIIVPRPRYALAGITRLMDPGPAIAPGIHPSAVVDPRPRRWDRARRSGRSWRSGPGRGSARGRGSGRTR